MSLIGLGWSAEGTLIFGPRARDVDLILGLTARDVNGESEKSETKMTARILKQDLNT